MINNANKILINTNSTLPNMSTTIISWFQNISFYLVERTMQGAQWVESKGEEIKTQGVVQPLKDKNLEILPLGTWNWEWLMVHCLPELNLEVNQYVFYDDKKYKVMAKKDWSKYGYIRYLLLEAYKSENIEDV